MARNRVIGGDGAMPWHLPAELQYFKAVTMGKPLIMGRKTFESIGRPLPGRTNIVITRQTDFTAEGILISPDWETALSLAGDIAQQDGVDEIMVIGGGEIYALALPRADRIYLTEVQIDAGGDTVFPEIDSGAWLERSRDSHPSCADAPGYDFILLER
jgi:dihydrofolate reductase